MLWQPGAFQKPTLWSLGFSGLGCDPWTKLPRYRFPQADPSTPKPSTADGEGVSGFGASGSVVFLYGSQREKLPSMGMAPHFKIDYWVVSKRRTPQTKPHKP